MTRSLVLFGLGLALLGAGLPAQPSSGTPGFTGLEQAPTAAPAAPRYTLPPTCYDMRAALKLLATSPALQRVYKVELEMLREVSALFERNPNLQEKLSLFISCGIEPSAGGSVIYHSLDRRMNGMMLILSGLARGDDPEAARLASQAWSQWREFIRFSRAVVRKVLSNPVKYANLEYYSEGARHLSHEDALRTRKALLMDRLARVAAVAPRVSFTGKIKDWETANTVSQAVIQDQLLAEDRATFDAYRRSGLTYGYTYLPLPLTLDRYKPGAAADFGASPEPAQDRFGKAAPGDEESGDLDARGR